MQSKSGTRSSTPHNRLAQRKLRSKEGLQSQRQCQDPRIKSARSPSRTCVAAPRWRRSASTWASIRRRTARGSSYGKFFISGSCDRLFGPQRGRGKPETRDSGARASSPPACSIGRTPGTRSGHNNAPDIRNGARLWAMALRRRAHGNAGRRLCHRPYCYGAAGSIASMGRRFSSSSRIVVYSRLRWD